jgi:hypothetical protein
MKNVTTLNRPNRSASPNRNKHMQEDEPKNHRLEGRKHEDGEVKEVHGTVLQYLLNPRGEVDGLLLEDGTFIKFPPHLERELAQVAKPNDEVTVIGSLEGPKVLRGNVIVNPKTEIALREIKPIPPERARVVGPLQPLRAEGKIRYAKRNPHGEIDGVILEDGTILQFTSQPGEVFSKQLENNQPLHAVGFGTSNQYGTSIAAAMFGWSRESLRPIGPAPHKPKKPKAHKKPEDEQED